MKTQLIILSTSIKSSFMSLSAIILTFFMPVSGLLGLIGFAIVLDTVTGVWKSIKMKKTVTSRRLSAIISKMLLYQVTVILFFLIDKFILNDIVKQFFSVDLLLTKILSLILVSIEVMSINENYKAVKGLDLWEAMKNLFSRAKEIKKDIDDFKD